MDALLARLARARRGPRFTFAITGGTLAVATVLILALRPDEVRAPTCEPPAHDLATVWSPTIAAELRAKTSAAHATVLEIAYSDWQAARAAACTVPPQIREAQLLCLDGALARFDALRQAFARVPDAGAEELQAQMIDPAVCRKADRCGGPAADPRANTRRDHGLRAVRPQPDRAQAERR
jgi:hypothetical protein